MIPPNPIYGKDASFWRWALREVQALRGAISLGCRTTSFPKGTHRIPVFDIERDMMPNEVFEIQHSLYFGVSEAYYGQIFPSVFKNGIFVGASHGELGYGTEDSPENQIPPRTSTPTREEILSYAGAGNPYIYTQPRQNPPSELLPDTTVRTQIYTAQSGRVRFRSTRSARPQSRQGGSNIDDPRYGYRISLYTIDPLPAVPAIVTFEEIEIDGETRWIETYESLPDGMSASYAVFDGREIAIQFGNTVVRRRATESNPIGYFDFINAVQKPKALHLEEPSSLTQVFMAGEAYPVRVLEWAVPVIEYPSSGDLSSDVLRGDVLLMHTRDAELEAEFDVSALVGNKAFFFEVSHGFHTPSFTSQPRVDLGLTIENL